MMFALEATSWQLCPPGTNFDHDFALEAKQDSAMHIMLVHKPGMVVLLTVVCIEAWCKNLSWIWFLDILQVLCSGASSSLFVLQYQVATQQKSILSAYLSCYILFGAKVMTVLFTCASSSFLLLAQVATKTQSNLSAYNYHVILLFWNKKSW